MFFEGVEKRLEIIVTGSLDVTRAEWEKLLHETKCSILSEIENKNCHAYLLSESSLFVWKNKMVLKTCGQIELLKCFPSLRELFQEKKCSPVWMCYSHREFQRPDLQPLPYQSVEKEWQVWQKLVDHNTKRHRRGLYHFFIWSNGIPVETRMCEVSTTQPLQITSSLWSEWDALVDEHWFTPQGYSANLLGDEWYLTLHLTPQVPAYLSIETDMDVDSLAYWCKRWFGKTIMEQMDTIELSVSCS
jgi:S-adenosylmethionine decarboxylase